MPSQHVTDDSFAELAKAIRSWLDYQVLCGRGQLLCEASLAQPVGDYLITHYSGSLVSEGPHPVLTKAKHGAVGRNRQIDFLLKSKERQFFDVAIECKWAGNVPKQAFVDDIMRLECFRREQLAEENTDGLVEDSRSIGSCNRFFILAGFKKPMNDFITQRINGTGNIPPPTFIDGLLPLNLSSKLSTIELKKCAAYHRAYFRAFHETYGVDLPNSYRARLIACAEGEESTVYVWKVGSMSKRRAFTPKDVWLPM
jgi:hypothetical protein